MSDIEQEVWAEELKRLVAEEETNSNDKLQTLMKPPDRDEMPRSAGMHMRSPQELLPRPQL